MINEKKKKDREYERNQREVCGRVWREGENDI